LAAISFCPGLTGRVGVVAVRGRRHAVAVGVGRDQHGRGLAGRERVALVAAEVVRAAAAVDLFRVAVLREDRVVAALRDRAIVPGAEVDRVVAPAADDGVVARPAVEAVVELLAGERVVAVVARRRAVRRAELEHVVAGSAVQPRVDQVRELAATG
jgi:hypothetical protein